MSLDKVFKYANEFKIEESEVEITKEIKDDQTELLDKMMKQLEFIQSDKERLLKELEAAEGKQREELANRKAEDTLNALAKALNIPGAE